MIKIQFLDSTIGKKLMEKNIEERNSHVSSGKLSASMLGQPLQWQVLKIIGVPTKEIDEYVLRKFQRGKDVEDWVVSQMIGLINKQKFVEYRDCVGYVDAIVDMRDWNLPNFGVIPHEIKSVANAKFKRIEKSGEADRGHKLQGGLYALALGTDHFAIDYVASDDYRIETYLYETAEVKEEIDQVINDFAQALKAGVLPVFQAKESWQSKLDYCNYPEFLELGEGQLEELLKSKYLESYNKLKANDTTNKTK